MHRKTFSPHEFEKEKTISYLMDIINGRRPGFFIGFVKSTNADEKDGVVGEVFSSMHNLSISKISIAGIKGLNALMESAEKKINEQKDAERGIMNPPSVIRSDSINTSPRVI